MAEKLNGDAPLVTEYGNENDDYQDYDRVIANREMEMNSLKELGSQRGTPIPSLFNTYYKFVLNPSSVSVETYKRMVDTDDTVGSGVDLLTTCLAARMGQYQHKSKEITSWVNKYLDNIKGGRFNLYRELCSATWAGMAVAEKVWANTSEGFVPERIVTLPPSTILFETERSGEITPQGILQYQRNYNPGLAGQSFGYFGGQFTTNLGFSAGYRPDMFAKLGDLPFPIRTGAAMQWLTVRIPRQKCIHYAYDAQGKFGNPYGRSRLRRAYKYYVLKDSFLQMLAIALDRKGTPLNVVFADHNTTLVDPRKAANAGAGGSARGQDVGIRADLAAKEAFRNIHNDSTIVLPGKKDSIYSIETIQQTAEGGNFVQAIQLCDTGMMRALLIPVLIFNGGGGDGGSNALGQAHWKTFDTICDGDTQALSQVLLEQLIFEMIAYNFPRSAWEKDGLGNFNKREMSMEEREKEAEIVDKAVAMGAVDMNDLEDLNQVRDIFKFKERDTPIERPENEMGDFGQGADGDGEPGAGKPFGGKPGGGKPPKKGPKAQGDGDGETD